MNTEDLCNAIDEHLAVIREAGVAMEMERWQALASNDTERLRRVGIIAAGFSRAIVQAARPIDEEIADPVTDATPLPEIEWD